MGRNTSSVKVGLLSSVSSNESGISEEEVSGEESRPQSQKRVTKCTRGCSLVLVNLAKTYRDVGRHCWPTIMYRQNRYPPPVKEIYHNTEINKCWYPRRIA